jgi:hypothetical protein
MAIIYVSFIFTISFTSFLDGFAKFLIDEFAGIILF